MTKQLVCRRHGNLALDGKLVNSVTDEFLILTFLSNFPV